MDEGHIDAAHRGEIERLEQAVAAAEKRLGEIERDVSLEGILHAATLAELIEQGLDAVKPRKTLPEIIQETIA